MNTWQHLNHRLSTKRGLYLGYGMIVLVCAFLFVLSKSITFSSSLQSRQDASGFDHQFGHRFLYFFYYTGHFPLATLRESPENSKAGALREINEHGDQLIMEYNHWSRLGENARILAYLPDAITKRSAQNPSMLLFNALLFSLGLMVLYRGTWKSGFPIIGLMTCILILSLPYYHYEVFENQNLFGLLHSVFFVTLGCMLPLYFSSTSTTKYYFLSISCSALLIGFASEMRNENSVILLSLLILILGIPKRSVLSKVAGIALVFFLYSGLKSGIHAYFDHQFKTSYALVQQKGGHPYTGGRIKGHQIWHNVFCGLGDYDTQYGHQWDDRTAYQFAIPSLSKQLGYQVPYSGKYHTDLYYDSAKLYYIKFDEIPEYETIMREAVISQIKENPSWYFTILLQRIGAILKTTLPFPNMGWLIFPLLFLLVRHRKGTWLILLTASFPLTIISLVVYSGRGATYNSLFPMMSLIMLCILLFEKISPQKSNEVNA